MIHGIVAAGLLLSGGATGSPGSGIGAPTSLGADQSAEPGSAQEEEAAGGRIAARATDGTVLTVQELDQLLLERHALAESGKELLELLLKARLLELLAEEQGVEVPPVDVTRRWEELDRQARAAGLDDGLLSEIADRGLTPEDFRDFLRLSIVQERLTRAALGRAEGAPVSGHEQEIWLDQEIAERGLETVAPPWPEGVIARCEGIEIETRELAEFLRQRLPRENVEEAAWHMLLLAGMEKRMPDLSPEARAQGIEAEIARRRERHAREHPEISFEMRLGAAGRTLDLLQRDPSVHIAVLSRLWVDQTSGPDGLRRTYEAERAFFDGRYGRAVRAHFLFLVASRYKNELNPRTFEEGERELEALRERVGNLDDFAALAGELSEEPNTRQRQGELGYVTRADPRIPEPIRGALFDFVDTGGEIPAEGRPIGPVRLDTGVALLWISDVREPPSWERMSEHVHEELRRRFVQDVLPPSDVELLLYQDR